MKSIHKWMLGGAALVFLGTEQSMAQSGYFEDALRFSQLRSTGSARVIGLGGTQNSLGGDISNIHGNAAGLGFFRRSEFSLSPSFSNWGTESLYQGAQSFERIPTTNFALPNLSLVIANPREDVGGTGFRGGSFGFSINRLANFHSEFAYSGISPGSITDFFAADAFGVPGQTLDMENSLTGLAYSTAIIAPTEPGGTEYVPFNPTESPTFYEEVFTEGGINQITFAYGANFNNNLFLGASLGVASINFTQTKLYTEDYATTDLVGFDITERLGINGTGVNLNLGAIYKPVDQVNLGLSFQSPTWYRLNEEYEASMVSEFVNPAETLQARTDFLISTYNLNTPMKVNLGATYFIGKNGFISADVDWVDYSAARINSRDFNPNLDNQAIGQLYTQTFNFRLGGEYRYEIFRARAGYGYYGDPFNDGQTDRHQQRISGGLGVRFPTFYVDLGIQNVMFTNFYSSYINGPIADVNNNMTSGILTVGFNF